MLQRHELKWIARPAVISFAVVFVLAVAVGLLRSKPLDMVFGLAAVLATTLAGFVAWKIVEAKRAPIAAAVKRGT